MTDVAISELLAGLNPQQREAVLTTSGPLLVIAGAGTGKTKVITSRIAKMLSDEIAPESIVAVSFTNKAAREMRERLAQMVGSTLAHRVELSTFHSFSLKILRKYAREFGLPTRFSVADEGQSKMILREVLRAENLTELFSMSLASEKIAYFKDRLFVAEDIIKSKGAFNGAVLRVLFEAYNRRLRLYNLVDFDDLVYLVALGLRNNPRVREEVNRQYRYIMVDEYQDTNNAQFELVRLLAGTVANICAVGDDDQSIYSWRGAKGEVLLGFLDAFSGAKRIALEQNYRCSQRILDVANAVIAENPKRLEKTLWSERSNQFPIRIHAAENERDEAQFVCDMIAEIWKNEGTEKLHDTAILVRASEQVGPMEQALSERGIPYHVHGGTRFVERAEVRALFSYLRLAISEDDLTALFGVINTPPRGIGVATLEQIKEKVIAKRGSAAQGRVVREVLTELAASNKGVRDFLDRWNRTLPQFAAATSLKGVADALRSATETMGLVDDIRREARDSDEVRWKSDLVERAIAMVENLSLREDFSLESVADHLHLDDVSPREKKTDSSGKIQLMTIHASKGLEFFTVFLVGAEDGILPHERAIAEGGVEEERRLFYVAITRAKQRLFISHCGFRARGASRGRERDRTQSRFLADIPRDFVVHSEAEMESAEVKKMASARRLFDLFR
jgi:DNA helicase-2/ATP-dependent DNA helicase PcrA